LKEKAKRDISHTWRGILFKGAQLFKDGIIWRIADGFHLTFGVKHVMRYHTSGWVLTLRTGVINHISLGKTTQQNLT